MKGHAEFPELDKSINEHAKAIVAGDLKAAWFKDTEGNTLALVQNA